MTNAIEEVDQEMLSTIKRHAGLGTALGIGIVMARAKRMQRPPQQIPRRRDRTGDRFRGIFSILAGLRSCKSRR
jgi:hypothetical protein